MGRGKCGKEREKHLGRVVRSRVDTNRKSEEDGLRYEMEFPKSLHPLIDVHRPPSRLRTKVTSTVRTATARLVTHVKIEAIMELFLTLHWAFLFIHR